jgi:hypothetical protein
MLKLTYTEAELHLERLATSLENLVAQRVILALRLGQPVQIEPGRAAFLLAATTPGLAQLTFTLQLEPNWAIAIAPVDADYVEVSLQGNWIATSTDTHEGMFISAFAERIEGLICKLWQHQGQVSFLV